MKYIRTKKGIYDEEKVILIADAMNGEIFVKKWIDDYISNLEKVIQQADTIEELCDEFVMVDNDNNKPYRPFIVCGWPLEELNERQSCNENLYGAIWTNKGLIYVAKMNDKGELELICID